MTTIVTRAGKGSPLTNAEMDANLTNLNSGKAEVAGSSSQAFAASTLSATGNITQGNANSLAWGNGTTNLQGNTTTNHLYTVVNSVIVTDATPTGLAVTGTLSATGILTVTGDNNVTGIGGAPHAIIKAGDTNNDFALQVFHTSAGGMIAAIGGKATTTGAAGVSVGELHFAVQNAGSTNDIVTISNSGLAVTGTLSVTTGAAVGGATAGTGGVAFPATAVAVADANTLDDYEEGTWTPVGSNVTFTTANGSYTKIGRMVVVRFEVVWPTTADAGNARIQGLPFTIAGGIQGFTGAIAYTTEATANNLFCVAGSAGVDIYNRSTSITNATMSSDGIYGTVTYFI